MPLATGTRLGPYEIVAGIGAGGMGDVYRAIDTRLDRTVAIKVLSPHVADSPARRQRFEREARAVSSLNHPHICSLYDVGEQDAAPFLVMEYVEGETLAHRLVRGALPLDQVLRYAVEIADALDHAHRQGIVHRDLKPANIMLTRAGVKLLDFGVAKLWASEAIAGRPTAVTRPLDTITDEGTIVGTLRYMAPEQLEGRATDGRADLFAFGAIVYEMSTGRPAFEGASQASAIAAILERDPAPLSAGRPDVPPMLAQLVTRCLAKSPDDRWQTARDLKEALTWITESRAQAASATATQPLARRSSAIRLGAVAIAALAIGAAVVVAMVGWRSSPSETRAIRFVVSPPENSSFTQSSAFMAVSPDGRALAFVASSRDGNNALWIRPLDSLAAKRLPGTDGASQIFWSPDSRLVAFTIFGPGADVLKKIDIVNAVPQTVANARAGFGAWNGEGTILYQVSGVSLGGQGGGTQPIYRVPAGGGSPVPATSLDSSRAETAHLWPQFLPDGRHFLYLARSTRPEHDGVVYAGSLDSSERIRLLSADSHAVYAPSGYLLFIRGNTLLAQPFDAPTRRLSGEAVPVAEQVERTAGSFRGAFSTSQAGNVLAYRTIAETELAWFDRGGHRIGAIGAPGAYSNPALSPDERQLAVARVDVERGTSDIWLIDLARGGVASRFTTDPGVETAPLWSPDGTRVVFRATGGFYQKSTNGTGREQLLLSHAGSMGLPLGWSRDGRALIFHDAGSKMDLDLWLLPLDRDRKPVPLLQTEFREAQAQLSPDGRWFAYASNESGRNEVYVRAFPSGEGRHQISTQGGLEPTWRGDGKELFYLAADRTLMSVPVTTGSTFEAGLPVRLFETRMSPLLNAGYTRNQYVVSADGQRILINQPPPSLPPSPITVVVNWTAALAR
jgi:serine/threonine protein kinase